MDMIAFVLISAGLIVVPGPNVLVIVSTSMTYGKLRGLQTVAGTSAAMLVQLIIAAVATHWFVSALVAGFYWLKWLGVAYLIWLGFQQFYAMANKGDAPVLSPIGSFQRGFWVSLTNPKTILFFSAFLPQFISTQQSYLSQIAVLSAVFWLLAIVLDGTYALLASRLAGFLQRANLTKVQQGVCGTLYLGAGAILAKLKRTAE